MDISNLVIRITTEGSDQAIGQLNNIKAMGQAAANTPVNIKIGKVDASQALSEFEKLRLAGVKASTMNISASDTKQYTAVIQQMNAAMALSPGVVDKINISTKGLSTSLTGIKAEAEKTTGAINNIGNSGTSTLKSFNDHLLRTARIIASVAVAFYLFRGAINVFKELLDTVDEFNTITIGIASTMTDMAKDQSNPQQNFIQNLSYTKDMYVQLENAANKFFSSGKELIQAWNILTQQGIVLQKSQIDNLGTIVDKIKLLTQGQVSSVQIAQELRAALMGQARPTDQLARIVKDRLGGAWKEVFQQIRETQTLDPLAKLFSGLEIARPFIQETLMSQLTTLWTNLTQATRMGMSDPYKDVVKYMKEWNVWLRENKELIGEKIAGAWEKIKIILTAVEDVVKGIVSLLQDPVLMTVLGTVLGGMAGGLPGAIGGAVLGYGVSGGSVANTVRQTAMPGSYAGTPYANMPNPNEVDNLVKMMDELINGQKKSAELNKELARTGVGFWTSIKYAIVGNWEAAEEAAIKYQAALDKIWGVSKKVAEQPLQPTEMVQRPKVFTDAAEKALQSASSLIVTLNNRVSGLSENSLDKIASDMAKMNDQIDKTIYKMKHEADTVKLATVYEEKLLAIRDKIVAQELEKRNREIYAYYIEGQADSLEKRFAIIAKEREDFMRKYGKGPTASAMEELVGDPILKAVQNAKSLNDEMKDGVSKWGTDFKGAMRDINQEMSTLIEKVKELRDLPPSGSGFLQKYLTGPSAPSVMGGNTLGLGTNLNLTTSLQDLKNAMNSVSAKMTGTIPVGVEGTMWGGNASHEARGSWGGDIGAAAGSVVTALTTMKIDMAKSYMSNSPGGMVWGTDQQGNRIKLHHIDPSVKSGDVVNPGDVLGTLSNIKSPHLDMKLADKFGDIIDWTENLSRGMKISTGGDKFKAAQAIADRNLLTKTGGMDASAIGTQKALYKMDLDSMDIQIKKNEALRNAYNTLAGMNLPAEEQNKLSEQALALEMMINQAKTEQLIKTFKFSEVDQSTLRSLNNKLETEKKRTEEINAQNRPLEQQKVWLGQVDSYVSKIASDSILFTDQLRYQEQSLQIKQKLSEIELQTFINTNKERLKDAGFDEDKIRSLHKQSQEAEKLKFEMSKWETLGFIGGANIYGVERANEAAKRGAADFKTIIDNLESTIGDTLGSSFMDAITGKKADLKAMLFSVLDTQVKQLFKMGVARGFDLLGNKPTGKGEGAGGFLGGLFGKDKVLGSSPGTPMYVEVVGLGMGKLGPAVPAFETKAQKIGMTMGGGDKESKWDDEYGHLKQYQKQYEKFYMIQMKDMRSIDKIEDKDFKEDTKQLGGYQKLYQKSMKGEFKLNDYYMDQQDEMIDKNQKLFSDEYLDSYQTDFGGMVSNISSIWSVGQGLMTAAGVDGDTKRIASLASFGMQALSILWNIVTKNVLMKAYSAGASAYASTWEYLGFPAAVVVAPIMAALAFAGTLAAGAMGGSAGGGELSSVSSGSVTANPNVAGSGRYHSGGVVGYGVAHEGLMVDERLIRAQVGEGIIKRDTMSAYAKRGISFDMLNTGKVGGEGGGGTVNNNTISVTHSPTYLYRATEADYKRDAKHIVKAINREIGTRGKTVGGKG